jgi:uncharacterized coiled-coil protein SlyX
MRRRTNDEKYEIILELRDIVAAQQGQIDQLTRSLAALKLVLKAVLKRNSEIETR